MSHLLGMQEIHTHIEVDEVIALVCDIRSCKQGSIKSVTVEDSRCDCRSGMYLPRALTEALANHAVPRGLELKVKVLLYEGSNVLFQLVQLHSLQLL